MPIQVIWDNEEQTIIRQIFSDPWELSAYYDAIKITNAMMDSNENLIDIIIDGSDAHALPRNLLSGLGYVEAHVHARERYVIAVTQNLLVKGFFGILKRVKPSLGAKVKLVNTLDEAYAAIQQLEIYQKQVPLTGNERD